MGRKMEVKADVMWAGRETRSDSDGDGWMRKSRGRGGEERRKAGLFVAGRQRRQSLSAEIK